MMMSHCSLFLSRLTDEEQRVELVACRHARPADAAKGRRESAGIRGLRGLAPPI